MLQDALILGDILDQGGTKEKGRQEPKKGQVWGQFGTGQSAEDHGGTSNSWTFYPQKGNKPVANNYNNYNVFHSARSTSPGMRRRIQEPGHGDEDHGGASNNQMLFPLKKINQ